MIHTCAVVDSLPYSVLLIQVDLADRVTAGYQ